MNILFLCPNIPGPPRHGNGVALRNFGFIKWLSKSHKLWLLTFYSNEEERHQINELRKYCIYVKAIPKKNNIINLVDKSIRSVFGSVPLRVLLWYSAEMKNNFVDTISENKFDIIHISTFMMTCYVNFSLEKQPVIVDFIDSKSLYIERDIKSSCKKFFIVPEIERKQVLSYEKEIVKKVKNCIYISGIDKNHISQYLNSGYNISIIPNGFWEIEEILNNEKKDPNSIAFVGDMSYLPNIDAVKYFHRKILPLVQKYIPEAKLYIIGRNPAKSVRSLSRHRNVIVTGEVVSVSEYLKKVTVFVCSMRIGSGMKLKILEAMTVGVPVVATTLANEGIWAEKGKEILVADNPDDFASLVIEVLSNDKLSRYIAHNATEFVRAKFSWEKIVSQLENAYKKVCC